MDPNQSGSAGQQPVQPTPNSPDQIGVQSGPTQQVSQTSPVFTPKSSSHKTLIIILVVGMMLLLLLAGGYYLLMQQQSSQSPSYTQQQTTTISPTATGEPVSTDVQSIENIDTGQNGIENDLQDLDKDLKQL